MHVAESPAERQLLTEAAGPLAQALRDLGVLPEGVFPWGPDPFGMLIDLLSKAPRVLMIHGNDLTDTEIEHLCRYPQITVVYCPRTHAFFGYPKHPVDRMLSAGIPVALGTESRASNPDLNLWHEVQYLLQYRTDLLPAEVLKMATTRGADALGRHELGRIAVGCSSDLGLIETSADTVDQLYRDICVQDYRWLEDDNSSAGVETDL